MGTKTYTSASVSNLNSSGKEYRAGHLSILEGSLATWQHIMQGDHLQETQRGGQGVGFRNWIYWAREYKFSQYNDPDIGPEDKTYNDMVSFYEPQVTAVVDIPTEQLEAFIKDKYGITSGSIIEKDATVTVIGQLPDKTFQEVTITGRVKKYTGYKLINSYTGAYDATKIGEAYVWQEYDKYLKDSIYIKRFIVTETNEKSYECIPGDNLAESGDNDTEVNIKGNWYDCWLQLGYEYDEPHEDQSTGESVIEIIFNSEKNIYVPVRSLVPNHDYYFALWGYSYQTIQLDANEFKFNDDGFLILNSQGKPIQTKPLLPPNPDDYEPEWKDIRYIHTFEYEDWEKTNKVEYNTNILLNTIKSFSYINDLNSTANDPNIGNSINPDIKNIASYMPPIVCFMNDKGWLSTDPKNYWFLRKSKACKKLNKDKDYYLTLHKELRKQINQGDIAWVYLMYGLPTNYAQTDYGAHYALQFFKQLTIPNWNKYTHGVVAQVNGRGVGYTYGARTFNFHYTFEMGNTFYACGRGLCPAPGFSVIRGGEAGVCNYKGKVTFWNQSTDKSWEYISISWYSAHFSWIKNGKSANPGGANWFLPIWKKQDVERQFTPCLIPLMWQVGKNIPFTNWTDLMQFCPNVGVTAYKVVETKWYETGIFKIIILIVVIVISIVISIVSGGTMSGPAASIGSAIAGAIGGSTAFWTAVAAVAITAAVGIAVNAIITPMLKAVFGEIIGSILGAIVGMIAGMYAATGTMDMTMMADALMNPTTWINIANAAVNGMAEVIAKKIKEEQNAFNAFMAKAEEKQDEILDAWSALGGKTKNKWAIQRVYGAATGNALDNCVVETASQFTNRCIDNCINSWENSIYTLEHYPELIIDNSTQPSTMFGGGTSNSSLGQTL